VVEQKKNVVVEWFMSLQHKLKYLWSDISAAIVEDCYYTC